MIAVTGATGHVGNVLARELLARGEEVRTVILPSEDTIPLEGLRVEMVEFVEPPHGTVIDETTPIDPDRVIGEYARSKAQATLEVLKGIKNGLDAVMVFPSGVLGPYDFRLSEMGQLIVDFVSGKLKMYVDGAYNFVDVRDVAQGHILACEKGPAGEGYILSNARITVRDLLSILEETTSIRAPSFKAPPWLAQFAARFTPLYCALTQTRPRVTTYSLYTLAANCLMSNEKARRRLGYSPRPIAESIEDSIKWFKEVGRL